MYFVGASELVSCILQGNFNGDNNLQEEFHVYATFCWGNLTNLAACLRDNLRRIHLFKATFHGRPLKKLKLKKLIITNTSQ